MSRVFQVFTIYFVICIYFGTGLKQIAKPITTVLRFKETEQTDLESASHRRRYCCRYGPQPRPPPPPPPPPEYDYRRLRRICIREPDCIWDCVRREVCVCVCGGYDYGYDEDYGYSRDGRTRRH